MLYFIWLVLFISTFCIFGEQLTANRLIGMLVVLFYFLLALGVVAPIDHYLNVTKKPILSARGKVVDKDIHGWTLEAKTYFVTILLVNKKRLYIAASKEQYTMLNQNDIIDITYQGHILRSFQRKTDKQPVMNRKHYPAK